jgi:hypothetical protein
MKTCNREALRGKKIDPKLTEKGSEKFKNNSTRIPGGYFLSRAIDILP